MKRVVTGHNQEGKSVVVSEGEPPRVVTSEHGNQLTYCWGTQKTPHGSGQWERSDALDVVALLCPRREVAEDSEWWEPEPVRKMHYQ